VELKFKTELALFPDEKERLRECIKDVYGQRVQIVVAPVFTAIEGLKTPPDSKRNEIAEDRADQSSTPSISNQHNQHNQHNEPSVPSTSSRDGFVDSPQATAKWMQFKNGLREALQFDSELYKVDMALSNTSLVGIKGKKLRMKTYGMWLVKLEDYRSNIEKLAEKYGIEIEIENSKDRRDILYLPFVKPNFKEFKFEDFIDLTKKLEEN
jgi:hypothetical protein